MSNIISKPLSSNVVSNKEKVDAKNIQKFTADVDKVRHYLELLTATASIAAENQDLSETPRFSVLHNLTSQIVVAKTIIYAFQGNTKQIDLEITRYENAIAGEDHKNTPVISEIVDQSPEAAVEEVNKEEDEKLN